jgi:hypothetical protein
LPWQPKGILVKIFFQGPEPIYFAHGIILWTSIKIFKLNFSGQNWLNLTVKKFSIMTLYRHEVRKAIFFLALTKTITTSDDLQFIFSKNIIINP